MLHLGELLFGQCKPAGIRSAGIYFWTAVIFSFLVQPVSAQVTPGDPGNFITIWKTNIEQTPNSTSFRIPTHSGSTYNYDLYWESVDDPGENGMLTGLTGSVSVSVPIPGTYRVEISGTFPRMYSASFSTGNPYQHKLLSIEQWGDIKWESMEYAFTYAANLNIHAADAPDLSNVTTMHSMFDGAISLNSDLNHWNVSNVKNMRRLFRGDYVAGSEFNGDISSWDVSNVTQMEDMFQNATSFNGDLSSWDVSNVEDMSGMFSRSFSFNSDLNHWDVSSVTNMVGMFDSASSFNGDISSWDVSGVRDMSGMFFNATSFNQDIGGWDVGMVEWMGNVGDTSIGGMFEDARSFDQDLGRWDVRNVRNMSQMLDRSGLSREHYDALLTGWSQLTLQQYGELDAAGLEYCAESARQHLIDTFDWYISGDRLAGDCSDPGTSPVVDASKSSVTATSPHLADGVGASVVTIELVVRDGNPLSGLQEGDFEIFLVSTMDQDVRAVAGPDILIHGANQKDLKIALLQAAQRVPVPDHQLYRHNRGAHSIGKVRGGGRDTRFGCIHHRRSARITAIACKPVPADVPIKRIDQMLTGRFSTILKARRI